MAAPRRPAKAEVTSSNTVGYQKINLASGYNMIGVQFNAVGGGEKDIATVGKLSTDMAGFDEIGVFATEMMVWENGDYTTYGWSGTSGTAYLQDSSFDNKWITDQLEVPVETIAETGAFWVKAGSAGAITISGQVPAPTEDVVVPLAAGYNMVANPFPMAVPVASFGALAAGMAGFDEIGVFATEMMVWENGDYTTYGWSGTSGTVYLQDSSFDNKWITDQLEIPGDSVTVPAGGAVWIKAGSSGSITFDAN